MGSNTGSGNESTGAETGFTTNFGVASPGSPADAMGSTVMPPSGGVGSGDPAGDESLSGDDQAHDLGLIQEGTSNPADSLRPRLVEDINPGSSNISGPTRSEEGSGG